MQNLRTAKNYWLDRFVVALCIAIGVPACGGAVDAPTTGNAASSQTVAWTACTSVYDTKAVSYDCPSDQFFIQRCTLPVANPDTFDGSECIAAAGTSDDPDHPSAGKSTVWCCK